MPRGFPDWRVGVENFGHYDLDGAEIATRLESPVTYNRSGRVVHIDRCINGLVTWEVTEVGTGAAVAVYTDKSYRYASSLRLTAGSDGAASASIAKNIPIWNLSRVGAEITFALTGNPGSFQLAIHHFDGTNSYDFSIGLFFDLGSIYYENSAGAWVVLTTLVDLTAKVEYWHTLKLVVDLTTLKYVKVMLDSVEVDMADIAGQTNTDSAPAHTEPTIICAGPGGSNPYCNVNDFIFTVDEP